MVDHFGIATALHAGGAIGVQHHAAVERDHQAAIDAGGFPGVARAGLGGQAAEGGVKVDRMGGVWYRCHDLLLIRRGEGPGRVVTFPG